MGSPRASAMVRSRVTPHSKGVAPPRPMVARRLTFKWRRSSVSAAYTRQHKVIPPEHVGGWFRHFVAQPGVVAEGLPLDLGIDKSPATGSRRCEPAVP